jgi:murein L,D-transpeptidase YafK
MTTIYDRTGLLAELAQGGFALGQQAFIRIFKRERELQVWMAPEGGRFAMFRSFPICTFSGQLGPKLREGDHQAPEGFYRVGLNQLNPGSRHHLAFNLGFPNEYDRQHGRTGSYLMVHGGCSSVGCYAMTDPAIDSIYAVVEAALEAGQEAVDVHIFPFALSEDALGPMGSHPAATFWRNLQEGDRHFLADGRPPRVAALFGRYVFGADADGPDCQPIRPWTERPIE